MVPLDRVARCWAGNFRSGKLAVTGHGEVERGRLVCGGLHHRHGLEPVAAIAGLQADPRELRLQVVDGLVLAGRAGSAAAECIRRKLLHMLREVAGIDGVIEGMAAGDGGGFSRRRGLGGGGLAVAARGACAQREQCERKRTEQGGRVAHRGAPVDVPRF